METSSFHGWIIPLYLMNGWSIPLFISHIIQLSYNYHIIIICMSPIIPWISILDIPYPWSQEILSSAGYSITQLEKAMGDVRGSRKVDSQTGDENFEALWVWWLWWVWRSGVLVLFSQSKNPAFEESVCLIFAAPFSTYPWEFQSYPKLSWHMMEYHQQT